jgi:hypothetical protein
MWSGGIEGGQTSSNRVGGSKGRERVVPHSEGNGAGRKGVMVSATSVKHSEQWRSASGI